MQYADYLGSESTLWHKSLPSGKWQPRGFSSSFVTSSEVLCVLSSRDSCTLIWASSCTPLVYCHHQGLFSPRFSNWLSRAWTAFVSVTHLQSLGNSLTVRIKSLALDFLGRELDHLLINTFCFFFQYFSFWSCEMGGIWSNSEDRRLWVDFPFRVWAWGVVLVAAGFLRVRLIVNTFLSFLGCLSCYQGRDNWILSDAFFFLHQELVIWSSCHGSAVNESD